MFGNVYLFMIFFPENIGELVLTIRKRKQLSPSDDTPPLDRFYDKL